jgi:hypothetical protein
MENSGKHFSWNGILWFVVVGIAWIMSSLGPVLTGSFHGSLVDRVIESFGSALGLLLISALPAFLVWLCFRLAKSPLSSRQFLIIYSFCVFIIGLFIIIGHFHNRQNKIRSSAVDHRSPFGKINYVIPIKNAGQAGWQVYINREFDIEFLTISVPQERRFDSAETVKVIWHIGFMEDGTNGAVDATRLKDGSLRSFSVTEQASDLRKGMEQSIKSKVISQKDIFINGIPAIEFKTSTTTKKGTLWYGVVRMLVIEDTLYSIMITCPTKERTFEQEIVRYLDSFKKTKNK